jgi:hypothetical protein
MTNLYEYLNPDEKIKQVTNLNVISLSMYFIIGYFPIDFMVFQKLYTTL